MITSLDIQRLAARRGVRRIAVENFLSSLDGLSFSEARSNLSLDAHLYRWNTATQKAIMDGLKAAYR